MSDLERRVAAESAARAAEAARKRDLLEQKQKAEREKAAAAAKPPVIPSVPGIKPRRGGAAPPGPLAIKLPEPKTGRRGAAFKPDKNIIDVANDLFTKANLPSVQDQNAAVKEFGISGARQQFKPTVDEAIARLGLAVIEPIIGGAEEATLGAIGNQNVLRPETQQLRIIGMVATPTAVDMVVGWTLAKAGATKLGRRVLKKVNNYLLDIGDPIFPKLTAVELDEYRQWEKLGGGLTHLRRTAQKNPKILNTIEEMAEFYEKNPAMFSAGASVIPEEVFMFQNLAREYDFEVDELINFIKTNDDFFADGTVLTALLGTLSKKDAKKLLQETTELPDIVIPDLINRIEDITVTRDTVEEIVKSSEEEKPVPIIAPPEVIPDVILDDDTKTGQKQKADQVLKEATITEAIPEEAIPDETTTTFRLSAKMKKERKGLNLRIFAGPKQKWRVTFDGKDPWTGDARGVVGALDKAQKGRRSKKQADTIIVKLVKG